MALTLAIFPLSAFASTGNIYINPSTITPTVTPSAPGQQVAAGGNVSLYFGGVTWSGSQFYLVMSQDGFAQVSTSDTKYTGLFDVFNLTSLTTVSMYINGTTGYKWDVGYGWVNGTIYSNLAGGNYWIKAYDGSSTSVAVTDTYITITGAIIVTPTSGNPGTSVTISGFAFPTNYLLNLSYLNPLTGPPFVSIANLVSVNSLGQFTYTVNVVDLMQTSSASTTTAGDAITLAGITFRAVNATGSATTYDAVFTEGARGLAQVRNTATGGTNRVASTGNLYGNNSNFATGTLAIANVGVGTTLRVAGSYFYAGALVVMFDNAVISNTAPTVNAAGSFNTTFVVPLTGNGVHNVTFIDGNNVAFRITVSVGPAISLSPSSGNVGITVTVTGTGFPASSGTDVYNAVLTWTGNAANLTLRKIAIIDANGQFITTFVVPHDFRGAHAVTATANDSSTTVATATFTVTVYFQVWFKSAEVSSTNTLNNTGLTAYANGTGFSATLYYVPNMDNVYMGIDGLGSGYSSNIIASSVGDITFQFIDAGFSPGTHVVSLYEEGSLSVAYKALFTVDSQTVDNTGTLLNAINQTVTQTNTTANTILNNLASMNATIVSISGTVATINTNVGLVQVSLSEMNATIVSINGTVATINTCCGSVQTSISNLDAKLTSINGTIATINTSVGTINTNLNAIGANVTSIKGTVATIQTNIGTLQTSVTSINTVVTTINGNTAGLSTTIGSLNTALSNLSPSLSSINSGIASIQTTLGSVTTSLSNLDAKITSLQNDTATIITCIGEATVKLDALGTSITSNGDGIVAIQTTLGTISGSITDVNNGIATIQTSLGQIQTNIGTLQTDVTATKSSSESLSPLIIVAIVLALIAAIAAIASIVLMRRKIAG